MTWTSSDESIATVDENGLVRGVTPGKTLITAITTDPRFDESVMTVHAVTVGNAVKSIELSGVDSSIPKGLSKKLIATITPDSVYNAKLNWSSSDDSILTVDASGTLRAVGTGSATITCAATDGSGISVSRKFAVYQSVTKLQAVERNPILFAGESITLHATVSPEDATTKEVTWSSNDPSILRVDSDGYVTGRRAGKGTITAKAADGSGKACTFNIIVEPAIPITVDSIGFGIYNANLFGLTVKNECSKHTITNFDFTIKLYDYSGSKLSTSGSYTIGSDVRINPGATTTIKRTHAGISQTYKLVITITGVYFSDKSFYSIPRSERETWTFTR